MLRRTAGTAKVCAVIKADAYGHGAVPVARRLVAEGVDAFAVALAEEGLELRSAGIETPIVVLNGVYGSAHRKVLAAGLSPVVYELGEVERFHRAADGARFSLHLKIDTGMSRLGVPAGELEAWLDGCAAFAGLELEGVMTHLACADSDDEFTAQQLETFERCLGQLRDRGHRPRVAHAANSAATFRHPGAHFDMVRPGLALFGHPGADDVEADLRPAMSLRSEIIALREVPPGGGVGYGLTFVAERASRIATVPIGYADGLFRSTSNRGHALVGGRRVPFAGTVSMDLMALDVTDVPGVDVGHEVVFLGSQGDQTILVAELAVAARTLPYEVLTSVSRRVPRSYR